MKEFLIQWRGCWPSDEARTALWRSCLLAVTERRCQIIEAMRGPYKLIWRSRDLFNTPSISRKSQRVSRIEMGMAEVWHKSWLLRLRCPAAPDSAVFLGPLVAESSGPREWRGSSFRPHERLGAGRGGAQDVRDHAMYRTLRFKLSCSMLGQLRGTEGPWPSISRHSTSKSFQLHSTNTGVAWKQLARHVGR